MTTYTNDTNKLFTRLTQLNNQDLLASEKFDLTILYRNEIVTLNKRLVPHVLKKYIPYTEDQQQAGYLGLILAANAYDSSRGVPFASFACFCIEREIIRMYRTAQGSIEEQLKNSFIYLDKIITTDVGELRTGELIPDIKSEQELNAMMTNTVVAELFEHIIIPCLKKQAEKARKYAPKADPDTWVNLEIQYFVGLCLEDSQQGRITLTSIAKKLGISIRNTKRKHGDVLAVIRDVWQKRLDAREET